LNPESEAANIWVIDRQDHWRVLMVGVLEAAGFSVRSYRRYEELLTESDEEPKPRPDLVLLSCAASQDEEQDLLSILVQRGCPVLILASFLSWTDVRELFRLGAADVVPRPATAARLLSVVGIDLTMITRKRKRLCHL
jgi:DNA-binding NtrC family response regulator